MGAGPARGQRGGSVFQPKRVQGRVASLQGRACSLAVAWPYFFTSHTTLNELHHNGITLPYSDATLPCNGAPCVPPLEPPCPLTHWARPEGCVLGLHFPRATWHYRLQGARMMHVPSLSHGLWGHEGTCMGATSD